MPATPPAPVPAAGPAARFVQDIETVLDQMILEHGKLLGYLQKQAEAMRAMDLGAMEQWRAQEEAARSRIRQADQRRRAAIGQVVRLHRLTSEPTLPQLAALYPASAAGLLARRDRLRVAAHEVALKANVASKLAGAVLGHLNHAVKLIASAVQHAGVYTRSGIPRVSPRIGVLEAVG